MTKSYLPELFMSIHATLMVIIVGMLAYAWDNEIPPTPCTAALITAAAFTLVLSYVTLDKRHRQ